MPDRDRLILSKGHGCLALYSLLYDKGFITENDLSQFCSPNGILGGHPEAGKVPGVEASTGSLGHGLPIGLGMAINARYEHRQTKVFVIIGDGESNEGSIWEAALIAGKHKLDNLTVIIDHNHIQSYGATKDVMDLEPYADKWISFGFGVKEADGHSVDELSRVFSALPITNGNPSCIICHTIKGKGIPEAEHNPSWHHINNITSEKTKELLKSLEDYRA